MLGSKAASVEKMLLINGWVPRKQSWVWARAKQEGKPIMEGKHDDPVRWVWTSTPGWFTRCAQEVFMNQ